MSASAPPVSGNGGSSESSSSITVVTTTGYHLLKIDGYSLTKVVPHPGHIKSSTFHVAGYNWHIKYYPNGSGSGRRDGVILGTPQEYVSLHLVLDDAVSSAVKGQFKFSLLDHAGEPVPATTRTIPMHILGVPMHILGVAAQRPQTGWCCWNFIKREALEQPQFLRNDCFTVRCDIAVVNGFRTVEAQAKAPFVVVPPSDLHRHLGELLWSEEGGDVTFQVGGETFKAHRYVLAARSSVFKAKLLGSMKESTSKDNIVHIEDMEAQVFKAVLHFMYTDLLSEMDGQEEAAMCQHLLEAADRFNLERLKLMCEGKLCEHIDASSVATTLVLAKQHNCHGLKKACLEFLRSPANLNAAMATDGFEHLTTSCPAVLKELMSKLGAEA